MPKITKAAGATYRTGEHPASPPPQPASTDEGGSRPLPPRPRVKDPKEVWVDYADAVGVDSSGSKAAIRKRVG